MAVPAPTRRNQSTALTGQRLVDRLHSLIDQAKERLWIASPYVGAWNDVRKILGSAWGKVDVRLIVDIDGGFLSLDTIQKFEAHRPVRSLPGLHAKLYIVDDSVLLTSANLTGTAFRKRHEAGIILDGPTAAKFVDLYEDLWRKSTEISAKDIPARKGPRGTGDEPNGLHLPELWTLPKSPEPESKAPGAFLDYPYFLEKYRLLVDLYLSCGKRDFPRIPKYFEVDALLDFLFRHDPSTSSKPYKDKPARTLTDTERKRDMAAARARFRKWGGFDKTFHGKHSHDVKNLLAAENIGRLSRAGMRELAKSLNCFNRHGLARHNFVSNNEPAVARTALFELIHGAGSATYRMNNCKAALFGFGRSAIQETMGYYFPDEFPLRNQSVNAGLRFFGYNVRVK